MNSLAVSYLRNLLWHRDRLLYLVFFVTDRCRARCSFCLNRDLASSDSAGLELRIKEIEKIAGSLGSLPHLVVTGGEPFEREDVSDIVRAFYRNAGTRLVTIPTNAFHPERTESAVEQILRDCPELYLRIVFSVHGGSSVHDQVIGLRGSFEALRQTYKRLKVLKANYPALSLVSLTVKTPALKGNVRELVSFFQSDMALDQHLLISPRRGRACSWQEGAFTQQEEAEWRDFSRTRKPIRGGRFWHIFASEVLRESRALMDRARFTGRPALPCVAGRRLAVLRPDGRVLACEIEKNCFLGAVQDFGYDLRRLLKSRRAADVIRKLAPERCICDWGCAMNINILSRWQKLLGAGWRALRKGGGG